MVANVDSIVSELRQRLVAARMGELDYSKTKDLWTRTRDRLDRALNSAVVLGEIPCGAAGPYADCPLISSAVAASKDVPVLESTMADIELQLLDRPPSAALTGEKLKSAMAELGDLRAQQAAFHAQEKSVREIVRLTAERADLVWDGWAKTENDYLGCRDSLGLVSRTHEAKKKALSDLCEEIAETRGTIEAYQAIESTTDRLGELRRDIEDWKIISEAYSPRGIPQYEVDAIGPCIAEDANNLLSVATDGRFRIEIQTERDLAGDKGTTEDMAVLVWDEHRQEKRRIETFSPGELSLLDTALRIALVVGRNEISEVQFTSLWFDEPTSPLNDLDLEEWIRLIRAAMDAHGFRTVFVVSHQDAFTDECDHWWRFADGALKPSELNQGRLL